MNDRRDFIKKLGMLGISAAALYLLPGYVRKNKDIGIQLYTLRSAVNDDVINVLKELSDIGYKNIEAYGFDGKFFGVEPADFKSIINDMGMRLTSTHTGLTTDNAPDIVEAANKAGLEYLVIPYPGSWSHQSIDDYKRMAEQFNIIGEEVSSAGMKLAYHNHALEFESENEQVFYDILLNETDPRLVGFQPDIYWFYKGGADPVKYFKKYPGRFILWHVKDMSDNGDTTAVGKGIIDFPEVFGFADISGMKYFYVEQEQYDKLPIECCADSWNYLNEMLG